MTKGISLEEWMAQVAPVHPARREYEKIAGQLLAVGAFVATIGPKDPRSGPFIAERIRALLGVELSSPAAPGVHEDPAPPPLTCHACRRQMDPGAILKKDPKTDALICPFCEARRVWL